MLKRAPILSAYFICALTPRPTSSNVAATPLCRIAPASANAFLRAASPMLPMYRSHGLAGGNAMPCASIKSRSRSSPMPKPKAGVGWPPISATRPSYRPPPQTVAWLPRSSVVNSNTVRV